MEKSFGLHFHLKKTGEKKLVALPIYLRITIDGLYKEISTKRQCETAKWNVEAGRVSGKTDLAQSVNNYLDVLQQKVYVHRKYLVQNDHPVSAEYQNAFARKRNNGSEVYGTNENS